MFTETVLSVRLTRICPHGKASNLCCGNAEWMQVIHEINRAAGEPYPIGEPTWTGDWWAGGWCEEYPEYRVVMQDGSTYIAAKTAETAGALKAAVLAVTGRTVDDNGMTVSREVRS